MDGAPIPDGIIVFDENITWIGSTQEYCAAAHSAIPEAVEGYITPGLVDIHCNGGKGGSFPDSDDTGVETAINFHRESGTTTLVASIITAPVEHLCERVALLKKYVSAGLIAGIHVEGPFLAREYCGAHQGHYIIDAHCEVVQRLLDASDNTIVAMTIAPENSGAQEVARYLSEHNILVSWGHSGASYQCTRQAIETLSAISPHAARQTITHLYNAMKPFHHRDPGIVAASHWAMSQGKVAAELIADGIHLHADTIRTVFDMFSPETIILVSDAMEAAGQPDGIYQLGAHRVQVSDGVSRVVLADGNLGPIAGSTATLADVVAYTVQCAQVPVVDALTSATIIPAQVLGVAEHRGSLTLGKHADIAVWDEHMRVKSVYCCGQQIR